jgi:hypothetical protein
MGENSIIFLWPLTAIAALVVSASSGNTKRAIGVSAIGGCLLFCLLIGAASEFGWFFGIFGMAFFPFLCAAAIGAFIGKLFRPTIPISEKNQERAVESEITKPSAD